MNCPVRIAGAGTIGQAHIKRGAGRGTRSDYRPLSEGTGAGLQSRRALLRRPRRWAVGNRTGWRSLSPPPTNCTSQTALRP